MDDDLLEEAVETLSNIYENGIEAEVDHKETQTISDVFDLFSRDKSMNY